MAFETLRIKIHVGLSQLFSDEGFDDNEKHSEDVFVSSGACCRRSR